MPMHKLCMITAHTANDINKISGDAKNWIKPLRLYRLWPSFFLQFFVFITTIKLFHKFIKSNKVIHHTNKAIQLFCKTLSFNKKQ